MKLAELALRPLAWNPLSRAMGRLAKWQAPRPVLRATLRAYVQHYGVNVDEMAEPLDSYQSFNAFFTRSLKPHIRPIDHAPNALVSPVDGFTSSAGPVERGQLFQVKGHPYSLAELLGDRRLADRLSAGAFCTIYLSPASYHRIHSPCDGQIVGFRYVPGKLFPVNQLAIHNVPNLFARNERLTTVIDSELTGRLALVAVGATNVGSISLSYDDFCSNLPRSHATTVDFAHPYPIARGAEVARFNLGSTVVLVWENAALRPLPFEQQQPVWLGQKLGETTASTTSP